MRNKLIFSNSPIYPDNSHIRWEIDGKGFVGNKIVFLLNDVNNGDSYSVRVIEQFKSLYMKQDSFDTIDQSPIFWESMEYAKIPNNKRFNHNARRAAMQWAEDYLLNVVNNQLVIA